MVEVSLLSASLAIQITGDEHLAGVTPAPMAVRAALQPRTKPFFVATASTWRSAC